MSNKCKPGEAYKEAIRPGDGVITRLINRRFSIRITCFLINHNIELSPNQLTVLIAFIGVLTGFLIIRNPLIGGVMVQVTSVLMCVDGEYARLTGRVTGFGAFLNSTLNSLAEAVIIGGSMIHLYGYMDDRVAAGLTIWILSSALIVSYLHCRGEASLGVDLRVKGLRSFADKDMRLFLLFIALILLPLSRGSYFIIIVLLGLISSIYILAKIVEAYIEYSLTSWRHRY